MNKINEQIKKIHKCPSCGGDGRETCDNPDHDFIYGPMLWHDIGRIGCPVCGGSDGFKVPNGGDCEVCDGTGNVDTKTYVEYTGEDPE